MNLILELPQALEHRLTIEANRAGEPLERYALRLLSGTEASAGQRPMGGAALVAHWRQEGVVGSRPDILDSSAHAREIRSRFEDVNGT